MSGRKRWGSTAGASGSAAASAANGTLRRSLRPLVRAVWVRIRKIQVFSDGAALEALEAGQHADPGVLDDLLGDGPAFDQRLRDPQQRRPVAVDERGEDRLVAGPQRRDQLVVGRRRQGPGTSSIANVLPSGSVNQAILPYPESWMPRSSVATGSS